MQIAFEVADGALARREISERDVDVGIDQARDCGGAIGVDDDVGALDRVGRKRADRRDPPVLHQNGIAFDERPTPVAGNDGSDVYYRRAHVLEPLPTPRG